MLSVTGMLGTHLGTDYLSILRSHLLVPGYIQLAGKSDIEGVKGVFKAWLCFWSAGDEAPTSWPPSYSPMLVCMHVCWAYMRCH